eukprot:1154808-Pelagomonas_calceolata.AAC.4
MIKLRLCLERLGIVQPLIAATTRICSLASTFTALPTLPYSACNREQANAALISMACQESSTTQASNKNFYSEHLQCHVFFAPPTSVHEDTED